MTLKNKIDTVKKRLTRLKKVGIAFSGGKDSFFLLKLAVETLGKKNVIAFFVKTNFSVDTDDKRVNYFKNRLDFILKEIKIDLSREKKIFLNPRDRCYFCKQKIFGTITDKAKQFSIKHILDGTTESDLDEYRPGIKALEEMNILSPLKEAGITSDEVIGFLKDLNINDYYLTSSTCLATRFPYGFNLDDKIIQRYNRIESFFVELGIYPVKIRYIPDGIRIETNTDQFDKILKKKEEIISFCKQHGATFVTLDMEGIKTGVWD